MSDFVSVFAALSHSFSHSNEQFHCLVCILIHSNQCKQLTLSLESNDSINRWKFVCILIQTTIGIALNLFVSFVDASWCLHNSHLFVCTLIESSYRFHTPHESLDSLEIEVRDRGEYACGKHLIRIAARIALLCSRLVRIDLRVT